jgi:fatty-acyl-CoA synthase
MVIRGGENIYPREIKELLYTHPKIGEVQVVGVPDQKMGEEVCAWIRLTPGETCTEQDIRDFSRDRIAHYKIPRYIRFAVEFPMTASGKVQKFLIRERLTRELGRSAYATM